MTKRAGLAEMQRSRFMENPWTGRMIGIGELYMLAGMVCEIHVEPRQPIGQPIGCRDDGRTIDRPSETLIDIDIQQRVALES